jgi:hypothetical protein
VHESAYVQTASFVKRKLLMLFDHCLHCRKRVAACLCGITIMTCVPVSEAAEPIVVGACEPVIVCPRVDPATLPDILHIELPERAPSPPPRNLTIPITTTAIAASTGLTWQSVGPFLWCLTAGTTAAIMAANGTSFLG